jgi:hypothetical protein
MGKRVTAGPTLRDAVVRRRVEAELRRTWDALALRRGGFDGSDPDPVGTKVLEATEGVLQRILGDRPLTET